MALSAYNYYDFFCLLFVLLLLLLSLLLLLKVDNDRYDTEERGAYIIYDFV